MVISARGAAWTMAAAIAMVTASCARADAVSEAGVTPQEAGILAASPTTTPAAPDLEQTSATDDGDVIRDMAFSYWEAFNGYDVEKVLAFLEPEYRAKREDELRSEIGLIETFGVTLGVSEHAPPRITDPGEGDMLMLMTEPLGNRVIRMAFLELEGEWKITYAEEVE